MSKSIENKKSFLEILRTLANEELKDRMKIQIAKKDFLLKNKEAIFYASEAGYPPKLILKALTEELLSTDIPKVMKWTNKEGEEKEKEVKFSLYEIKKFLEAKE